LPLSPVSGPVASVGSVVNLTDGWPVKVGDLVTVPYEGQPSWGRVEAVAGGRALIRLTVRAATDWTSPLTGGTVPPAAPALTYCGSPPATARRLTGREAHECHGRGRRPFTAGGRALAVANRLAPHHPRPVGRYAARLRA